MSPELRITPKAKAAVCKQGAIHSWAIALAEKKRRPVAEVLASIASIVFLDWESAVDQQQALRIELGRLGCPTELTTVSEWDALVAIQHQAAAESAPEVNAWRNRQ